MKKHLTRISALSFAFLSLLAITPPAQATHYQGADLTYAPLAPNIYSVEVVVYRDCSGIAFDQNIVFLMNSPGCNTGRGLNLPLGSGTQVTGNPYCPSAAPSAICNNTATLPNYQIGYYRGTVTFSATEQLCSDWYFSSSLVTRPSTENLVGQNNLFAEAYLKLGNTINNFSAVFGPLGQATPFVANVGMAMVYTNNATDPDGDSIAYSLVRAMSDAATPVPYKTFNPGPFIENKNPSPPFNTTTNKQYASVPPGISNYNTTFPMPSFLINWNSTSQVVPAVPHFELNPQNGNLSFMPGIYNTNTNPADGRNKYTVVVQADEFRKINGVVTKVGYVRRDMVINIVEGGGNSNPHIPSLRVGNAVISPDSLIRLRPGVPLNLQFDAADLNAADSVYMQTDVMQRIPGAVFMKTPGLKPTGTITWTPTAAHISSTPHYFTVYLKDNACPARGIHARAIGISVTANGSVTSVPGKETAVSGFAIYPNPFQSETKFRLDIKKQHAASEILIFNILGQQVDRIKLIGLSSGKQELVWKNAVLQPAGQYVARLVGAENSVQTLKFIKLN